MLNLLFVFKQSKKKQSYKCKDNNLSQLLNLKNKMPAPPNVQLSCSIMSISFNMIY